MHMIVRALRCAHELANRHTLMYTDTHTHTHTHTYTDTHTHTYTHTHTHTHTYTHTVELSLVLTWFVCLCVPRTSTYFDMMFVSVYQEQVLILTWFVCLCVPRTSTHFDMICLCLCTKNKYSSLDLSGMRVEHNMEKFKEGSNIVLTLKDKGGAVFLCQHWGWTVEWQPSA